MTEPKPTDPVSAVDSSAEATAAQAEPADAAQLKAELERLQAENEELRKQPAGNADHTRTARIWRWVAAIVLVVIASGIMFAGIGAVWVNRFLTDTDVFVSTLSPLAADPDIQKAVATSANDAIFNSIDIEAQLQTLLLGLQDVVQPALEKRGITTPNVPVEALAAPLANSIENAIREQTLALVQSPQFQELWDQSLRVGHESLLQAVDRAQTAQQNGIITVQGDTLYLNVNPFAKAVQQRLVDRGLGFVGKLSLDRAQGQVKIVQSEALFVALSAARALRVFAWLLPLLALVLFGLAVFAAPDRRRGLVAVGIGLLVIALLGLMGFNLGRVAVAEVASGTGVAAAAIVAAYEILPAGLVAILRLVLGISLLLIIGAVLTGPARWAVSFRSWLSQVVEGTGPGAKIGAFVERYRTPLAGGGVLLGILFVVVWPDVTGPVIFWTGVVVLIWVFLVEALGRRGQAAGGAKAT